MIFTIASMYLKMAFGLPRLLRGENSKRFSFTPKSPKNLTLGHLTSLLYRVFHLKNISPGPMSKITSYSRVRGRGFITKIIVRGIARVRGDSSKTSGSDS